MKYAILVLASFFRLHIFYQMRLLSKSFYTTCVPTTPKKNRNLLSQILHRKSSKKKVWRKKVTSNKKKNFVLQIYSWGGLSG